MAVNKLILKPFFRAIYKLNRQNYTLQITKYNYATYYHI